MAESEAIRSCHNGGRNPRAGVVMRAAGGRERAQGAGTRGKSDTFLFSIALSFPENGRRGDSID